MCGIIGACRHERRWSAGNKVQERACARARAPGPEVGGAKGQLDAGGAWVVQAAVAVPRGAGAGARHDVVGPGVGVGADGGQRGGGLRGPVGLGLNVAVGAGGCGVLVQGSSRCVDVRVWGKGKRTHHRQRRRLAAMAQQRTPTFCVIASLPSGALSLGVPSGCLRSGMTGRAAAARSGRDQALRARIVAQR